MNHTSASWNPLPPSQRPRTNIDDAGGTEDPWKECTRMTMIALQEGGSTPAGHPHK